MNTLPEAGLLGVSAGIHSKKPSMLPTFIIIGAMKSGTTSLHHYLHEHPEICMSRVKETNFFLGEEDYARGVEWYESLFCECGAKARGETSPNYAMHPLVLDVPERMHALIPDAKLIYLLRDPIERMISHYIHKQAKGVEQRSLVDVLAASFEEPGYIAPSLYYTQLQKFLRYYRAENILIITAEDLKWNRLPTLRKVFRFLEVDAGFKSPNYSRVYHLSSRKTMSPAEQAILNSRIVRAIRPLVPSTVKRAFRGIEQMTESRPSIPSDLRARLADRLRPEVEALRAHTGERFARWSL